MNKELREEACNQNHFGLCSRQMRNSDKQRANSESSKRREEIMITDDL